MTLQIITNKIIRMRIFFVFLFFSSFSAYSQECNLKRDVDADNQPRLTTGFLNFGKGSTNFLLSMDAGKRDIDFFF